jgi:hypothetical protein
MTREQMELLPVNTLRTICGERVTVAMEKLGALHLVAVTHGDYTTARDADVALRILWSEIESNPLVPGAVVWLEAPLMGVGGFVTSARTGANFIIEPGTTLEETLAALEEHLDADTLAALARSTGAAKSRRTTSLFPLCEAHPALAD